MDLTLNIIIWLVPLLLYLDATKLKIGKVAENPDDGEDDFYCNYSAGAWAFFSILVMIVALPIYLWHRRGLVKRAKKYPVAVGSWHRFFVSILILIIQGIFVLAMDVVFHNSGNAPSTISSSDNATGSISSNTSHWRFSSTIDSFTNQRIIQSTRTVDIDIGTIEATAFCASDGLFLRFTLSPDILHSGFDKYAGSWTNDGRAFIPYMLKFDNEPPVDTISLGSQMNAIGVPISDMERLRNTKEISLRFSVVDSHSEDSKHPDTKVEDIQIQLSDLQQLYASCPATHGLVKSQQ